MTSARSPFATPTERLATYFDCAQPPDTFGDGDIDEIAALLEQCGHVASKCPRTYILFRTIGQVEIVERLVNAGFSDKFFPVEARNLPTFLDLNVIQAVVQQQSIILTKSLDLENGRHRHFTPGETLPFEILGRLGSGGYGQVDRILSRTSFKQYALKRIRRRAAFGNTSSREAVKGFLNEMKILRSLEHRHIVQYIGSYTDKSYLGLVMSPVADTDLASYNTRLCGLLQAIQADKSSFYLQDQPVTAEMSSSLRTFYGCLTAALRHLHEQNIRHKDIKPQNILVAKSNVLLTDFGLSHDFADDVGSTTSGVTPASARYCAPEVASYEARNTSSDIWSLGCVFLEMTAALQGLNVEWIKQFFLQCGSEGTHFHNNLTATARLIGKLKIEGDPRDQRTLTWIESMVVPHRGTRLTAAQVFELITSPETSDVDVTPNMFCGICCVPDLESDSLDSLADDLDVVTAIPPKGHGSRESLARQPQTDDFQSSAQTIIESKTNKELHAPNIHTSKAVPSVIAALDGTRTSDTQRFNSTSFAIATSYAEIPRGSPKTNKSDVAPFPIKTLLESRTNVNAEPPLQSKVSSDEDITPDASALSQSEHSSQREATSDAEMSPTPETSKQESSVDVSPDDLRHRLRKVFGQSISVSTEYASHELGFLKTIGGATLSGRIPTVVSNCGSLLQNPFDRNNILAKYVSPSSPAESDLFYRLPWLPEAFKVDNDRNGYIKPLHWQDSGKVLHAYLSTLPNPIIPPKIMIRFQQIVWGSDTRVEKQKRLQIALLQMRPPYCLTVLYLLNLCASCAKLYPKDKNAIVEAYYPSFFGPNMASIELKQWETKSVLKFMIDHAEYILGGPIEGDTVSEDNELLLQKIHGYQASLGSVNRWTTSPINKEQAGPSISTPDIKGHKASLGGSKSSIKRARVVGELLEESITDAGAEKFSSCIDAYVNESPSLKVMEMPLWITTCFAGVERSTFDDLDNGVKIDCVVPIIIAECCTMIISKTGPKTSDNELRYSNSNIFKLSSTLNQQSDIEQTTSLLSIFNKHPEFGRGLVRPECKTRNLGTVLFTYLISLPEPIIPYSTTRKMMDLITASRSSRSTVEKGLRSYISNMPKPNRETLIYLLLFLNRLNHATADIGRLFEPVIIRLKVAEFPEATTLVNHMIRYAPSIIEPSPGPRVRFRPIALEDDTLEALPKRATSSSSQNLVVAKFHFRPETEGALPLRTGDLIRVISRIGQKDGWWLGKAGGQTGIFPGNFTRPYDPEEPKDQSARRKSSSLVAEPEGKREKGSKRTGAKNEAKLPGQKLSFRSALHGLFDRSEKE